MENTINYWMSDMRAGIQGADIKCILDKLLKEKDSNILWHYIAHYAQKEYFRGYEQGKERVKNELKRMKNAMCN